MTLEAIIAAIAAGTAALEIGSRLLPKTLDYDCRAADGYRADRNSWGTEYFREWRKVQVNFSWEPFSYWRSAPWRGRFINVDERGVRRTVGPEDGAASPDDRPRIFLFGGSTMWGAGVRDEGTIASHCAAILAERGRPVAVTNCGQIGYVSTQSTITLLRLLQEGTIPDVVVFYDGYNDVLSALTNGAAGFAFNEQRRGAEFNILHRTKDLLLAGIRSLHVYQLATASRGRRRPPPADPTRLSEDIARRYLANLAMVTALGQGFGFATRFYWQPTIFHKPALTGFERSERDKIGGFERAFDLVEGRLAANRESGGRGPVTLSRFFQNETRPVFLDWAHLTESANRQVAERIASDIEAALDGGLPLPTRRGESAAMPAYAAGRPQSLAV